MSAAVGREVVVCSDAAAVAAAAVARIEQLARDAVSARGAFRIALTGGSSAKLLYPALLDAALPGAQTHVYWSDERYMPAGDAERNDVLARQLWLDSSDVRAGNVHTAPALGSRADLAAAAARYEADLGDAPLDLVHLGIGPDGHVCSLFPGHPLLRERQRRVVAIADSPKPPTLRVTFTLRPLFEARVVLFTLIGAEKAALLREVLVDATSQLPAALVARHSRTVWLLDEAAARDIPLAMRSAS